MSKKLNFINNNSTHIALTYLLSLFFSFIMIVGIIYLASILQLRALDSIMPAVALIFGIIPQLIYLHTNWRETKQFEIEKKNIERKYESYQTREQIYNNLLQGLKGIYVNGKNSDQELLIETYNRMWLYCPDEIVKQIGHIWDVVKVENKIDSNQENLIAQEQISKLILLCREDLISIEPLNTTNISIQDYKHIRAMDSQDSDKKQE